MQINNNNKQAFTSIYTVKVPLAQAKEFHEVTAPLFSKMLNKNIGTFYGNSPIEIPKTLDSIEEARKLTGGYSKEWLISHAKQFGIKIPDFKEPLLWVFTGKDCAEIGKYLTKHEDGGPFLNKLRLFIYGHNALKRSYLNNIPDNLRTLYLNLEVNKFFSKHFQKYFEKFGIDSSSKNIEDLLEKIVSEKRI